MHVESVQRFIADLRSGFLADDPNSADKTLELTNVARLQTQYVALLHGDYASFLSSFDDDVECELLGPPSMPIVGRWVGKQEVIAALGRNFSLFENQRPVLLSVVAQGDMVVVAARETGHYRPASRDYESHFVQFFTFKDGKIIRLRQICDHLPIHNSMTPTEPSV